MNKLLYITVNSKPEELSSSRTVGRAFVNRFLEVHPEFSVEELDLYKEHIPRLEYQYFESRNCIVNEEACEQLPEKEKQEVHKIVKLCNQFREADVYVIAAPVWSLSFPAPLKEYIDCIVQTGKTIKFEGERPIGLLGDRTRTAVYIQSSGGNIPWIAKPIFNKGLNYVEDIFKMMGIMKFQELLVDSTGLTEEDRQHAMERAKGKIDDIIKNVKFDSLIHS